MAQPGTLESTPFHVRSHNEVSVPTTTISQPKSGRRFAPSILTVLLGILVLCAIASYVIPAGAFDRGPDGGIIPGTYELVSPAWVSPLDLLVSIHTGLVESAPIIFGIMITGGMLQVLDAHGVISRALYRLAIRTGSSRYLVIIVVMLFFGIMGGLGTITSEVIAFFPLGVVLARALGLTPLTGVMAILLSSGVGYSSTFLNPSSLALSQTIAGIPVFSGMGYRIAQLAVFLAVVIVFMLIRVRREARAASASEGAALTDDVLSSAAPEGAAGPFSVRHGLALGAFFLSLGIFIAGTALFGWGVGEMSACFLLASLLVAVIFQMRPIDAYNHFIDGMKSLVWVTVVVGVARAISVVLADGQILDTIVNGLAQLLVALPVESGAVALFVASSAINFLVGSGTGQAALTMPIISPLTELMGITQQVGVLGFQLGDGITNMIYPTSATLVAALATARTSYGRWIREAGWLLLLLLALAAASMVLAVWIGYN